MSQLTFQYTAISDRGQRIKGVLQAIDQTDAYRALAAQGLRPLRIRGRRRARRQRITTKDLSHLTYQFSVLLEARIPISEGLRAIAEQENNARLAEVLHDVAQQIEGGCSVTEAMSPYRNLFGDVYIETVRAAETSGNMIQVLSRLAEMLEQQYDMQKNVRGALIYPSCVVIALGLAITFLMMFVVPKFAAMYGDRGIELPAMTRLLMGFSGFVRGYWWAMLGAGVVGAVGLRKAWRNDASRARLDTWLHHVPFMRAVLKGVAISRFAQVFGLSLQSGLSLIDSLDMAGRASARPLLMADAEKMRFKVNHGGRLSDVMMACEYLPTFAKRMITAGEEAGELPRLCQIVARHYDREVSHLTRNVSTVIEPILIAGLAGIVLIVALAIFLPMWNMASLIG